MRKWFIRSALLQGAILFLVFAMRPTPLLEVWQPLPAGKVTPQLTCNGDAAVLLAPDGSLWTWGGAHEALTNLLPQPALSQYPRRIGLVAESS